MVPSAGAIYDPNIYRRKLAMRPQLTYYFSVHYPTPHIAGKMKVSFLEAQTLGNVVESFVTVRQGWLAHFREDTGPFHLAKILSNIHNYVRYT
jgi:hypothetical protein